MQDRTPSLHQMVVFLAALVIVLAGIRAASSVVAPFLIAVFVATLARPLVFWLHLQRGVPKAIAIFLVGIVVIAFLVLIGLVVVDTLQAFNQNLSTYQQQLNDVLEPFDEWIMGLLTQLGMESSYAELREGVSLQNFGRFIGGALQRFGSIGGTLQRFGSILTTSLNILATSLLVAFIVMFMLLEAFRLPDKLKAVAKDAGELSAQFRRFDKAFKHFAVSIQKYIAIKTATSLATGVAVGTWVFIMDVDFPLFWGLLAFLLNYIPNVGSLIAAAPAILLAVIQLDIGSAAAVAAGYLVINIVIGNAIEPKFMGDRVGLSPLVVVLSLVFWGWLIGVVGLLLSTPLTMTAKMAVDSFPEARWMSTLIGSGLPESRTRSRKENARAAKEESSEADEDSA